MLAHLVTSPEFSHIFLQKQKRNNIEIGNEDVFTMNDEYVVGTRPAGHVRKIVQKAEEQP